MRLLILPGAGVQGTFYAVKVLACGPDVTVLATLHQGLCSEVATPNFRYCIAIRGRIYGSRVSFRVRYTRGARDDLRRLHSFVLKKDIRLPVERATPSPRAYRFLLNPHSAAARQSRIHRCCANLSFHLAPPTMSRCSRSRTATPLPSLQSATSGKTIAH